MIRLLIVILLPVLFLDQTGNIGFVPLSQPNYAVDSIEINIDPLYDSLGLLDGYKARVFTPICEEDKCYAVEIDFYWDAIGRFNHYDTIPGQPLTKLEHEPFTPEEYLKLHEILKNPSSVLANYKKEELVLDIEEEGVDAVSGATISEIKESVISGAVYSCYTLWHIGHGSVVDSIQSRTMGALNNDLVDKLVEQDDQQINYFLIKRFRERDFITYLDQVLLTIQNGQGYYPKNAIEQMPGSIFAEETLQLFLSERFESFNYFTQVSILKKLEPAPISNQLKVVLTGQIDDRDSQKNRLIQALIGEETIE